MKIALVNPNTSASTTAMMVAIARRTLPPGAEVTGITATFGAPLITDTKALDIAAQAVVALADRLDGYDGVIIAAFGDPGLLALRALLPCPVTGIAEAALREAAGNGRRFAVATTTPGLRAAIAQQAASLPGARFAGTFITPGDPHHVMADPARLVAALQQACDAAITQGRAEAVIIGGGPLGAAADALRDRLPVPLIAPIPAATRLLCARIKDLT